MFNQASVDRFNPLQLVLKLWLGGRGQLFEKEDPNPYYLPALPQILFSGFM
jgi:hypothetical protein